MVRPVLQNFPLSFSRRSSHNGLERSSSHRRREDKELLSSTGHTVSSVKSFASSSTANSKENGETTPQSRPSVFVGRTKHLERLVAEISLDSTKLVVIHGPEGCGKTWLFEEYRRFHDEHPSPASLVLFSSFAKTCTYEDPLAPIWQALFPILEEREDVVEEFSPFLECFLPQLQCTQEEGLSSPGGGGDSQTSRISRRIDNWDRERLLAFLLRLCRRLSERQPTECDEKPRGFVWILDDLHDASSDVLHLLQTILLNVQGTRFLASCLPVTDNNSALARWLVHLKRHKLDSTAMVMRPLNNMSLKNIMQLLERQYLLLPPTEGETVKSTSEKFVRALAKQIEGFTAGHALSVSQLLRLVNDLGCFKRNELHELPYTTLEKISKLPIDPASCLHQVVRLRLRALPDPVQRTLRIAAAYSSQLFSVETLYCLFQSLHLSKVQDKDQLDPFIKAPDELRELLEYALCVGFLVFHEQDGVYGFVHPLVRDIVLRTLSNNDPPRLHYQLGLVFRDVLLSSASFALDGLPVMSPAGTAPSYTLDARGVSHWNRLILNRSEPSSLTDRDVSDLAAWNRRVALQAQRRQCCFVSAKHFETAIALLERIPESQLPDSGSIRQEIWLTWTCERIPVELACGHHEVAKSLAIQVRRTLTTSAPYLSIARSTIVAVQHRQFMQGQPCEPKNDKAIEGCLKWLKELGDGLPERVLGFAVKMHRKTP
jgi:AAA ATPase domain